MTSIRNAPSTVAQPKQALRDVATTKRAERAEVPAERQWPRPAAHAKGVADAYTALFLAETMKGEVAGSVKINTAADRLLTSTAEHLAMQLEDRDQEKPAAQVQAEVKQFLADLGEPVKPNKSRNSQQSVEANLARHEKVLAKLSELADRLATVNAEPNGEHQQAYNRSAIGSAGEQEARFAVALGKAYARNPEKAVQAANRALTSMPRVVEKQVESHGGSLEQLERSGAESQALKQLIGKLDGLGARRALSLDGR